MPESIFFIIMETLDYSLAGYKTLIGPNFWSPVEQREEGLCEQGVSI